MPTWKRISVTAMFYDGVDTDAIIEFVNKGLALPQPAPVVIEKLEDQDWERVWLDQYQALQIHNDFWIVPSWKEAPETDSINLLMDPGLAFGTGTHATTYLCLEWLAQNRNEFQRVLDYGAGSGILAIGSLLLGAKNALLVDIDPMAVKAASENLEQNGVDHLAKSIVTPEFEQSESYDLVIANILAEVLCDNAELLSNSLMNGGMLLLSGILSTQEALVTNTFLNYAKFDFQKIEKDGWLLLVAKKNASH